MLQAIRKREVLQSKGYTACKKQKNYFLWNSGHLFFKCVVQCIQYHVLYGTGQWPVYSKWQSHNALHVCISKRKGKLLVCSIKINQENKHRITWIIFAVTEVDTNHPEKRREQTAFIEVQSCNIHVLNWSVEATVHH